MNYDPTVVRQPTTHTACLGDEGVSPLDSAMLLHRLEAERSARSFWVTGSQRKIEVKIASEPREWEEAYRLVSASYRARGYEPPGSSSIRFTPYHALPDTATLIAKHENKIVATLSYVADNTLLGLPMESVFSDEIAQLRRAGRRMAEATSLADSNLGVREFVVVFEALIRLAMQYHANQGGDTWVISINPRHRNFYTKAVGFIPLAGCRPYPLVQDAPAEAYTVDYPMMKVNAPKMHAQVFGEWLPPQVLQATKMPRHLVQYYTRQSTQTSAACLRSIFDYEDSHGSPRRWLAVRSPTSAPAPKKSLV